MAIAIGAAPAVAPLRAIMTDFYGRSVTKTTLLDGAIDDTSLLEILNDFAALTRCEFGKTEVGGRIVTGLPDTASDSLFPEVTDLAELTFTRENPVNAAKTITKSFLIPGIQSSVVDTDKSLIVGTPGTGSLTDRLARLIGNLETFLAVLGSDGVYYTGSFTFAPTRSGKISAPGV